MVTVAIMFAGATLFAFGMLTGASIMLSIHAAKNGEEED